MRLLLGLLAELMPGPIASDLGLDSALAACWDTLDGHGDGGMKNYKLLGRMEDIQWQPMILTFTIERHGGTVQGSTRAELQHWEVNLKDCTACITNEGHRQKKPMASRISVKAIVDEIVELILSGKDDERILRHDDGSVKVRASRVFPDGEVYKQTLQGRRKRLVECVRDQLAEHGWVAVSRNVFRKHE